MQPPSSNCDAVKPDAQPLYDTHAHFFTADTVRYPINPAGAREGEDALAHRIATDPGTPERVFSLWDANGVVGGAAVQFNTAYKTDNRYVCDIVADHPQRLAAVVILDANDPATPAQLARMISDGPGITGLRLVGYANAECRYTFLTSDDAMASWAEAERLGLAVVLMIRLSPGESPAPTLARVAQLARRFPAARIVLDHCGWPGSGQDADAVGLTPAHRALAACPNIFLKVSSINFTRFDAARIDPARFMRAAVDHFGAERMMWGSDFGNTLIDYAMLAARARTSAALLNETEQRAYLHDTGAAIFAQRRT